MTWLTDELSRLLADDYLYSIEELTLPEIRAMRAECQRAETAVSYLRRMAQGRLDIIHVFLDRREDGASTADLAILVEELPAIMAAGPPRQAVQPGSARPEAYSSPDTEGSDLTVELDAEIDLGRIGDLPEMGEAELRGIARRLTAIEERISNERRALHERIDRLQAEIVSRYKTGEASVDGLLS
jgi:hypothetical protein